ncbi:sensor histidine kinase [Floridanema evergladense]|uniref:histidine kinase n=1 Tax=Floridaenema evergladense BLCC-F167 TaxID=3153639 RepID=A0ABV4WIN6_9CYAN
MKTYDYQNGQKMINPSGDEIERLFSVLSHELRTPITSLQAALDLLQMYQQEEQSSEVQALLTLATDNTDRLTQIIENILDWYEITHKTDIMFKQPIDGAILIKCVVDKLQPLAIQQRVQIYLDIPKSIPLNVDNYYLSRALSYLLRNAIKFSGSDRQVWLTATVVQTLDSAIRATHELPFTLPYVLITVKDQGAGIPETALKQIFEPFQQVDSSDTRHYGGLGLELAICDRIIQQHQGKIWAESTLGDGSTFYVALPIKK